MNYKNIEAIFCTIKAGTIGWYKYLFNIDRASNYTANTRMNICTACHHIRYRNILGIKFRQCYVCKCPLAIKTKIRDTKCDMGKW